MLPSGVAGACGLAPARGNQQSSLSSTNTQDSSPGIAVVAVTAYLIPVKGAVCHVWGQGGIRVPPIVCAWCMFGLNRDVAIKKPKEQYPVQSLEEPQKMPPAYLHDAHPCLTPFSPAS